MKRTSFLFCCLFFLSCGNDDPQPIDINTPNVTPTEPVGSGNNDVLIWSEEFDYEGEPDSKVWTIETGNGDWGWGNGEVQYYRDENLSVSDGTLKITTKKEKIISNKLKFDKPEVKEEYSEKLTIFMWVFAITAFLLTVLYSKTSAIINEFPFTEKFMLEYQQLIRDGINSVYNSDIIIKILSFW